MQPLYKIYPLRNILYLWYMKAFFVFSIPFLTLGCILCPGSLSSQQNDEDLRFLNREVGINQIQSQEGLSVLLSSRATSVDAGVLITQIGTFNQNSVQTQAENSEINLSQFGNLNMMALELRARNIVYSANQTGNNNRLIEFNSGFLAKELIQREILQFGNDQDIIIHGNNSISDKLRIRMEKSGQSLIIRNSN